MLRRVTVLVVVAVIVGAVLTSGGDDVAAPETATLRNIDTFAVVESVNVDSGWSPAGETTSASMRLVLDDLRTITIPAGTMVHDGTDPASCTSFDVARSCVLLADMLGEAVVWFALVNADRSRGTERLTLPGLVDMRDDGDRGVLGNGWVLPLATPVVRECGDTDTGNLREFITRFGGPSSTSVVDLVRDEVVRVRCS